MASRSEAKLALMTQLARLARDNIASFIPRRAYGRLRDSIRFIVNRDRVIIYSYYYWARFVNDGRGPVRADDDKVLVFYEDPQDDPRIKRGYPRKPEQVKRLTKRQLRSGIERGLIIVAQEVGPAEGLGFIEDGIRKTRDEVAGSALKQIRGDVRRLISRGNNKITVTL